MAYDGHNRRKDDSRLTTLENKFDTFLQASTDFRKEVTEGLREVRHAINGTGAQIGISEYIRKLNDKIQDVEKIDVRVMTLENDKAKLMGGKTAIFTAAAFIAFLTSILTKWWAK